jgi:hypothetical protein
MRNNLLLYNIYIKGRFIPEEPVFQMYGTAFGFAWQV